MSGIPARTRRWSSFVVIGVSTIAIAGAIMGGKQHPSTRPEPQLDRGKAIYSDYCARCHGGDGNGVAGRNDLRNRPIWKQPADDVITVLAFGVAGSEAAGAIRASMPPIPYDDGDLAAVATYTIQQFGDRTVRITPEHVRNAKEHHRAKVRERLLR
ncbi:MAG: cytochrome c [Candidatus Kapabacteria bacterium]|jgi:mono/diheme cytochrome c family protein|nr:cytochrome c [Candidatus Kapabacteria bacterium]